MNQYHTQYISPLSMLDVQNKTSFDKKDMLLAKKKLLAELELGGQTTINFNGKELSKNDIVNFFDQLQTIEHLPYHQAVAEDKVLLSFLEGTNQYIPHNFTNNPIYFDPRFIEWISPYFYLSFVHDANIFFKAVNTAAWEKLLTNPRLMSLQHKEKAWTFIEGLIEEKIEQLKDIHANGKVAIGNNDTIAQIEKLCDHHIINMVLLLPENRFGSQRDEYAFEMMQVLIDMFNAQNRSYAMDTLKNAKILAHSEYVQQELQDKYHEMQGIVSNRTYSEPGKKSTISDWGGARLIFFLVFVVFKLITCNNNNSNDSKYDNYGVTFQKSPYTVTNTPDALPVENTTAPVAGPSSGGTGEGRSTDMTNPAATAMRKFANSIFNSRYVLNDSFPLKNLRTGDDPYRDVWKNVYVSKNESNVKNFLFPIENKGTLDVIILVTTNTKVFSVYVKPGERYTISLPQGDNTVTPYLGANFRVGPGFIYVNPVTGKKIVAGGLFTERIGYNLQWLNRPMSHYLSTADTTAGHMEISDGGTVTDVYLFDK